MCHCNKLTWSTLVFKLNTWNSINKQMVFCDGDVVLYVENGVGNPEWKVDGLSRLLNCLENGLPQYLLKGASLTRLIQGRNISDLSTCLCWIWGRTLLNHIFTVSPLGTYSEHLRSHDSWKSAASPEIHNTKNFMHNHQRV